MRGWIAVVVLALCVGPAMAAPVSLDITPLNGLPLRPGDPVEVRTGFTTTQAEPAGELIIHQFKVAEDGTRTAGRQFDIVSVTGPGVTPQELIYVIENQACMTALDDGWEVCSEVVPLPVHDSGWAWSGMPVLE
ncbi:MAG TPA: hypothetical protein VM537_35000 [Anaerolineae bacterium]|nr:hypothetical protein [Anaerolineae bacterium]